MRSSSRLAIDDVRAACDVLPARLARDGAAATATSRSRSTPTSPPTAAATFDQAVDLHGRVDRPNLYVKIPATREGLPAIEDCIARGDPDQRDADLLARALPRGRRRLPARARAPRRRRRRPRQGQLGRLVLRLADRHRGRPRGSSELGNTAELAGEARDREREARLPPLRAGVLRAGLGAAGRRRARASSGRSGPRPRPRTPPTAT